MGGTNGITVGGAKKGSILLLFIFPVDVLPEGILKNLQSYVSSETIYVPKKMHAERIAADDNPMKLMSIAMKPLTAPPFPLERIEEMTRLMGGDGSMK